MKIGIMQPYFFPYIGYFQLINAVDEFVVYDDIEYTKKGWINRNRILMNGQDQYITVPLKKDSDFLDVSKRQLADTWKTEKKKALNKIANSYLKAPYFKSVFPFIEQAFDFEDENLFGFLFYSLKLTMQALEIATPMTIASTISLKEGLKGKEKVISICQAKHADTYINPIGGAELYSKEDFRTCRFDCYFIKTNEIEYKQFNHPFVPNLSIIDVMMFNSKTEMRDLLQAFILT